MQFDNDDIQQTQCNGKLTGNYRLLLDDGFVDLPGSGGPKTVIAARRAYQVIENGGTKEEAEDAAWS